MKKGQPVNETKNAQSGEFDAHRFRKYIRNISATELHEQLSRVELNPKKENLIEKEFLRRHKNASEKPSKTKGLGWGAERLR